MMATTGCILDLISTLSLSAQTYISFDYVVGVCGDVPGQAKITDLCHSSLCQEDIPCCQVSVDTLGEKCNATFNT